MDKTIAQNSTTSLTTQSIKDAYGRNYQTIAGGISSEIGYDGNGRKDSVTTKHLSSASPTDGVTYTSYDTLDRVSTITNPDGSKKSFAYIGKVLTESDEMYNQKQETFDAFNEVSAVTESDPASGALDLTTVYQRDGLGNIICVEQHGNTSGAGCSSPQSSDPSSAWRVRRFFYNSLGQMVASEIPEHMSLPSKPPSQSCGLSSGNVWTDCYVYDSDGNLKVATDNSGATTNYIYDALSRVTSQISSSVQNAYTYDAGGGSNGIGLLASQASQHSQSTFSYDVMGRTLGESSCRNSGCTSSVFYKTQAGYDLAGNVTSVIYPDGRVIQNGYDTLNRPTSVVYHQWQYPTGPTVGTTYWSSGSYAPPGQITAATYGNGMQMQASYGDRQTIASLSYQANNAAIFNKSYQWDKNATNLLLETNNISSQYRQFQYDRLNRLASGMDMQTPSSKATGTATISGSEGSTQYCRPIYPGSLKMICYPIYDQGTVAITVGGYTASTTYNMGSTAATIATALVTQLNSGASPVTAVLSGTSTIQMTSVTGGSSADYSISTTYGRDFPVALSGGTLTGGANGTPSGSGLNQQYAYDNWGNLTQMGGTSGFSQPSNNQNQVAAYQYDAGGRLLNDGFHGYTYDSNGMLLTSSDGASYTYDGKEQRSSVTTGGAESDYYYFGGRLYAIYNAYGWTDLIYAGSQRIGTVAGTTQTAAPVYDVLDHIGSEVATVNGGNGSQSSLDYTPYGQVLSGTNSDSFVFTGLQRDPDGLDHADMRQYTSTAGRWITADPYNGSYDIENPQSLNRYAYVNNNPLGFVDPTGEALGVVNGVGGSLCKAAYLAMQISMGPINPCNPVGSLITIGITAAINSLSLYGSSGLTIGSWSVGGSALGSSVTAAEVGPFVSAALTITCSIDYNPVACGPKGWASDVIGGNTGKIVGDSLAVTGDALMYEYGPACAAAAGSPADPACDIVYAVALYTLFNDIFSELFGKSNFKGSLLPRPNARGGSSPTDIGVPDIGKVSGNSIKQ